MRLRNLMRPNSLAVVPTSPIANYSHDTDYVFRAGSDFFYLTGFREPESVALISTVDGKPPFTLFLRPRDPERETWTGRRAGVDGAREIYRADEVFVITEFKEKLPGYLENLDAVYIFPGRNHKFDKKVLGAWQDVRMKWRLGVDTPVEFIDLGHLLNEMRLFKTPEDMEILKQACRITCEAHELAMMAVKPGMNERELEALVNHYFRANGAFGPGFPTIVASGENACILHYVENEREIRHGDLVLLDAGAEYEFFNGDVTRTFPANGVFTPEQKAVYEVVLDAQSKAMELCTVGRIPEEMHDAAVVALVEGMIHLGILAGSAGEIIEKETYKKYYMHKTGHWLGADVHDVGSYRKDRKWRKFEPGMVTTVEPGLYLPGEDESLPVGFRGIGVRIEDNVHITPKGPENITYPCPKTIAELEDITGKK
jgi:Xaa-Pro aminopeptidase